MLKSVAYVLINPIFWLVVLIALYFVFNTLNKIKASKVMLYLTAFWLLLVYVSPLPQFLVVSLENQYPVFNKEEGIKDSVNILVLGAGVSKSRIVEGARIYNQSKKAKLIFSGNSVSNSVSVAKRMSDIAVDLGVKPQDTLMNIHPNNTAQEVEAYIKRFGSTKKLILVTSASHLPRAMAHFNEFDVFPIPAPSDFMVIDDFGEIEYNFKPSLKKIELMQLALKEYAGILWVKIKS